MNQGTLTFSDAMRTLGWEPEASEFGSVEVELEGLRVSVDSGLRDGCVSIMTWLFDVTSDDFWRVEALAYQVNKDSFMLRARPHKMPFGYVLMLDYDLSTDGDISSQYLAATVRHFAVEAHGMLAGFDLSSLEQCVGPLARPRPEQVGALSGTAKLAGRAIYHLDGAFSVEGTGPVGRQFIQLHQSRGQITWSTPHWREWAVTHLGTPEG
jgi:hypothetical protein